MIAKLREIRRRQIRTPEGEARRLAAVVGRHHTAEEKEKIGRKGAQHWAFGRRLPAAHIAILTAAATGRKPTPTTTAKRKASLTRWWHEHPEAREALIERQSGHKSHFWCGGISFREYTVDWTETLRRSIRERDRYTCQLCGSQQCDVTFPVHHIDYNKTHCDPINLTTLCVHCHVKTNYNRDYWLATFAMVALAAQQQP
jgi:hypothetical protein